MFCMKCRRRAEIPAFPKGNSQKALKWLAERVDKRGKAFIINEKRKKKWANYMIAHLQGGCYADSLLNLYPAYMPSPPLYKNSKKCLEMFHCIFLKNKV